MLNLIIIPLIGVYWLSIIVALDLINIALHSYKGECNTPLILLMFILSLIPIVNTIIVVNYYVDIADNYSKYEKVFKKYSIFKSIFKKF